jgi:hypothetical protein
VIEQVGAMPTPHAEEPERFPGGPDALEDQSRYGEIPDGPLGVDLPPDKNPAAANDGTQLPEGVTESDDKSQEPDERDEKSEEPETPV